MWTTLYNHKLRKHSNNWSVDPKNIRLNIRAVNGLTGIDKKSVHLVLRERFNTNSFTLVLNLVN